MAVHGVGMVNAIFRLWFFCMLLIVTMDLSHESFKHWNALKYVIRGPSLFVKTFARSFRGNTKAYWIVLSSNIKPYILRSSLYGPRNRYTSRNKPEVKYIDFFIFIRISEIDILDSSICAQKQLRMRMILSLFYIVSYIFMMIFLTFTCCQHGMSSSVSYSPFYIYMLYIKTSVLPRHRHVIYFRVNVIYFKTRVLKYNNITFTFDVKYIGVNHL